VCEQCFEDLWFIIKIKFCVSSNQSVLQVPSPDSFSFIFTCLFLHTIHIVVSVYFQSRIDQARYNPTVLVSVLLVQTLTGVQLLRHTGSDAFDGSVVR